MNEDRWGDHGYSVRCVDCGELIGHDRTLDPSPRVCLPCAAGKPPSDVRHCIRCGAQRSRFDPDWKGGFCGDCDGHVLAEREAVIRKAKASGQWDAMLAKFRDIHWSLD